MHLNRQFAISLPDAWNETTVHTFLGPHDSGVQHNLVLTVLEAVDKGVALSKLAKEHVEAAASALPGFEFISEREVALASSLHMYETVYRYSPTDDQMYFQKQYFIVSGSTAYAFTATFSKKTLQTIANEVDKIVGSFRPPPAAGKS